MELLIQYYFTRPLVVLFLSTTATTRLRRLIGSTGLTSGGPLCLRLARLLLQRRSLRRWIYV